jgi:hypothetical protein
MNGSIESTAREAGLAFVNGASGGWIASDLSSWSQKHLLAPRFFTPKRPELGVYMVEETGAGRLALPVNVGEHPDRAATSNAMRIVAAAHERVLATLRGLLATPPDDRFLNAALYTGRVQRGRGGVWSPSLDEGGNLSQWVLALFAADALHDRAPYDTVLGVCDACNAVGFAWRSRSRNRCPSHDGIPSARPTPRSLTLPPEPPAAAPTAADARVPVIPKERQITVPPPARDPVDELPAEDLRSTRPWGK